MIKFIGTCEELQARDLEAFDDSAEDISNAQFRQILGEPLYLALEKRFGCGEGRGLLLSQDHCVSYSCGLWKDQQAICCMWSCIHHIWVTGIRGCSRCQTEDRNACDCPKECCVCCTPLQLQEDMEWPETGELLCWSCQHARIEYLETERAQPVLGRRQPDAIRAANLNLRAAHTLVRWYDELNKGSWPPALGATQDADVRTDFMNWITYELGERHMRAVRRSLRKPERKQ